MNEVRERKKGVILSYISIFLTTIIQLTYTPFLIKSLGQSEYGLYSIVSSIIGYLTVLDLGFGNSIIVYTAKYHAKGEFEKEKKLHGMFLMVYSIIGIISFIVGIGLFFLTPTMFGGSLTVAEISKMKIMMIILSFNLAFTFPFTVYGSIITAYERFTFRKITSICSTIIKPLIMIPLLFLGYKSITMCIVITIVNLLIMVSNYLYCKRKVHVDVKYCGIDKTIFKEIIGFSLWIFLNQIVDKANWSIDNFILGAVCGTVATSVYAVAGQINMMFVNLSTAISGVLLPKISKMIANKATDEEITNEFIKIGRLQFYVLFLFVTGFSILGKKFITLWAGPEYVNSFYIMIILMIPSFFSLIQNTGISILQAKKMHKFRSVLYFFIAIANVIISIPLAMLWQGIGSAIGTSVSLIIGNIIIINIYYYKKANIDVVKFWKEISLMIIKYLIPIICILMIIYLTKFDGWISIIIYATIYTTIYSIVTYKFVMNKYEKSIIQKLIRKFKREGI